MDNITALQRIFQRVQSLVNGPDATKWITSKLLNDSISELKAEFNGLLQVLGAVQGTAGKKHQKFFWRLRKLKWPLQKEDIEKILQLLERHKTSLIAAISCDEM